MKPATHDLCIVSSLGGCKCANAHSRICCIYCNTLATLYDKSMQGSLCPPRRFLFCNDSLVCSLGLHVCGRICSGGNGSMPKSMHLGIAVSLAAYLVITTLLLLQRYPYSKSPGTLKVQSTYVRFHIGETYISGLEGSANFSAIF